MYDHACVQASTDSRGLSGQYRPSTQEIVSETVNTLYEDLDEVDSRKIELQTKDLCDLRSIPQKGYDEFLVNVLKRLMGVIRSKFIASGGQLFVCTHEAKRKGDRFYFPAVPGSTPLTSYVGVSLKVVLQLSGGRQKDDVAYDSLFSPSFEDSCFPLSLMQELQKRGIILKIERHAYQKHGVIYTLFFPKESTTIQ
jgi:hypothetical protein